MDEQEMLFDKIEDYIRGKLLEAEEKAFEQAIASDPQLALEVKKHRVEHMAMEGILAQELLENIQTWKAKELSSNKPESPKRWRLLILFGLVTVVLITLVFYYLKKSRATPEPMPKSQEQIMRNVIEAPEAPPPDAIETPAASEAEEPPPPADPIAQANPKERTPANHAGTATSIAFAEEILAFYHTPEHLQVWLRGSDSQSANPVLDEALKAYENKNYLEAIQLLITSSDSDYRNELLAHVYFENGNYTQAAALFRDMTLAGYTSVVQDRMEWNLLLSLLMEGASGKEEASQLLSKITTPGNHHYYEESGNKLAIAIGMK